MDDSVRKTWELDHVQFRLSNPRWLAFLAREVLAPAAAQLGLVGASLKPHKLLLYEPGSFFARHKDSEKEPGMVGTLVVCLLSAYEGGDVRLSFHGTARKYETAPTSKYDMTALVWFGDVWHEVEELTAGFRLVLTYNLVVPTDNISRGAPSASFFSAQAETLQRALAAWSEAGCGGYNHIYYPLEHQYSETGLSLGSIKGRDAAVCQVLQHVADAAGFCVFLGSLVHRKERQEDSYEEDEESTGLDRVYTSQGGQLVIQNLNVHRMEVPYRRLGYGNDDAADSWKEPEYLGNEDSPAIFRYHHTVRYPIPTLSLPCSRS